MKYILPILLTVLCFSNKVFAQPASPLTVIDASGPNTCDGSASITNPNNVIANTIVWYTNGAILAQGVTSVSNLCPGTYGVYYTTFIDSVTATFVISGSPCNGLQAIISGTAASSPMAMDGSATVSAIGGSAPYAFTWSNGATTSTILGLGVGVYSCCVADMNGCVSCDSFTVSATINPGNDTVFVINNNNIPNVIDSLGMQQVLDCSIDYNAIGAAYISNSQYIPGGNPNTMDSIYLTWQVYDTLIPSNLMATYVVGYSVFPPLAQAYTASIEIHCPQKNTNYNTLLVIDQFYTSQLGVIESSYVPTICLQDGCASINLLTPQSGELNVYSMNGNLMVKQGVANVSTAKIQMANWNPGIYFMHYNLTSGSNGVLRFVKP
ncbi:MAG: T9SS type A sorting domain-containing protein [Flavobacteriales bacterium]